MTIPVDTRIGPFTIAALVGSGGMGAVYRAHDARLRRDVAIKVLAPDFAASPDRLRRFEQEALAVARLAHPNILAIHDVGRHDGAPYMVTELLEGETLADRIRRSPLPVPKTIEFARQIARGLAAAHAHGIVHRDIKPANIFITRDGGVKILDFGIAKLREVNAAAASTVETETVADLGPTGTAAYMSPEQARGDRVDLRSDLFSLGVVVHEMLSGVSPFRRDTSAETMTAVLREDAPDLPESVACPEPLKRILRHCLEKDPADRFQSAPDLVFALDGIEAAATSTSKRSRRFMPLALVTGLVAAAVGGFLLGRQADRPSPGMAVTTVHRLTDFSGVEDFPSIAPDHKAVAFSARVDGYQQIFVRLMASGRPRQITTDAADHEVPRWSPDGSSIIYFSPAVPGAVQGTIWEIPALGGAPRRLTDSIGAADVGKDGRLVCFRLNGGRTELVATSREAADVQVIANMTDPAYYRYPRWSPDGRWVAYQAGDGFRWDLYALPATGGAPRQLTRDNRQIHGLAWRPDSAGIIYSSSRGTTMPYLPTLGLWEVALDGDPPRQAVSTDVSYLHPDVHSDGTIVASRLNVGFDLWRYPLDSSAEENVRRGLRITRQTGQVQTPTVGSDDREIAFLSDSGGRVNLWTMTTTTGEWRQITHERDPSVTLGVPIWSAAANRIGFVSSRGLTGLAFGIWTVSPDGSNMRNLVPRGLGMTWSSDGQWVYYLDEGTIYKVPSAGGTPVVVRPGRARNVVAVHGTTLFFMVDRTLTDGSPGFEIHAASPEDAPSRVIARIAASRAPQWQIVQPALSPDGQTLALPLTDGATTNIWTLSTASGEWRQVTDFGDRPIFIARRVSWSADGRSLLAAVGEGDADIVVFESKPAR